MAYTETTTVGYGTRVGNSFKQIGTGFLMFIAGTILLWWNEGNYKKTADMLEEAQKVTVEMTDINKVDPQLEGQLVYATGEAHTDDILQDPQYPVAGNFMHLRRQVEYYQWQEHKQEQRRDKVGGGEEIVTTYTYSKDWVSSPINSSGFKESGHSNTQRVIVEDGKVDAKNVAFGAYTLPDFFINAIGTYTPADVLTEEQFNQVVGGGNAISAMGADTTVEATDSLTDDATIDATLEPGEVSDDEMEPQPLDNGTAYTQTVSRDYQVNGNVIYYGVSSGSPQIGDVRITFTKVDPKATVSLLGKVQGTTFVKYKAKNGKTFSRLEQGTISSDEMFSNAESENDMLKWGLRLLGVLLVIGGLKGIFNFLTILLKVIPFLASIMNFGVGLICTVVGIVWSLLVIGLAWLFYRPLVGIPILAVAIGLIVWFAMRGRSKQPAVQPEVAGAQQPMPGQGQPHRPAQQPYQPQQPQQQPYQPQQQQPYQQQQPQQQPYQQPQQQPYQQQPQQQQPQQQQPYQQQPQQQQPYQPQQPQQQQPYQPQQPQQGGYPYGQQAQQGGFPFGKQPQQPNDTTQQQ